MWQGVVIFLMVALFIAGGLIAFWRSAHSSLPKNLPPPLKDEDEEEKWHQPAGRSSDTPNK